MRYIINILKVQTKRGNNHLSPICCTSRGVREGYLVPLFLINFPTDDVGKQL